MGSDPERAAQQVENGFLSASSASQWVYRLGLELYLIFKLQQGFLRGFHVFGSPVEIWCSLNVQHSEKR